MDIVRAVKAQVSIPVAVKVGPYFQLLRQYGGAVRQVPAPMDLSFLIASTSRILIWSNSRFAECLLSTTQALRLPLSWIAILYGRVQVNLALTSGVHKRRM